MSQTGYLVVAFSVLVAVLAGWIGIMVAKLARIRREGADEGPTPGRSGG